MRNFLAFLMASLFCIQFAWGQSNISTDHIISDDILEVFTPTTNQTNVELFEKYEAEVNLKVGFINPHDPAHISVDAEITLPDASTISYPMFHKETDTSNGHSTWGFRFAPRTEGQYSYVIKVNKDELSKSSEAITFEATSTEEKGFLHSTGEKTNFTFDNGDSFRGIGMNIAWEARLSIGDNPKYTYDFWFDLMNEHNINYVRTWVNAPWNLPLEWNDPNFGRYSKHEDVGYHPEGIERFDYMIEEAEKNGIYLMLAMDYHGALWVNNNDGWGNNFWNKHPYKELAGCENPNDFFTFDEAKRLYKNRMRYIISRWGYSTSVGAIEFFNEVDNTIFYAGQNVNEADVVAWHKEMAEYLISIDYHEHVITTSISHKEINKLFDIDELDLIQSHIYGNSQSITNNITYYSDKYDKPYAVGETGVSWDGSNKNKGLWEKDLKYSIWTSLFEQTPVLPMSWWWEDFEAWDSYNMFSLLREVTDNMTPKTANDFLKLSLTSTVSGYEEKAILVDKRDAHIFLNNTSNQNFTDFAIQVAGIPNGQYTVKVYDAYSYELLNEEEKSPNSSGRITLGIDRLQNGNGIYIAILNKHRGDITGNDDPKEVGIKYYPNPTNRVLNFELDPSMTAPKTKIQVFNTLGHLVLQSPFNKSIDISFLPLGFYILRLSDGAKVASGKFLKN
ncbi:T9SS type A sorting domain-containing protein [Sediminitomix flava]|uniref:Putative secreted protein (Por secretion system target) n=1 Tax=Sediminitomix flava TaxID=379075 RepID=A0A315ZC52_SEDFL|nr:T9SS type A sorting domain-containing protein [Sediminitomix flava]PWJ43155.1 putative secreted protein (Por secretion system target) [Sediminitomix flava]